MLRINRFGLAHLWCAAILAQPMALGQGHPAGKARYPFAIAGVKIGVSKDDDVKRRYGKGYFVADESHLGGRYFVDPGHTVTLHTMIGTDHCIDGIDYELGIHLPSKTNPKALTTAETPRLTGKERVDDLVSLGATVHDVRAVYGKPVKDTVEQGVRTLAYTVAAYKADSLPYDVNFNFRGGRLVGVSFDFSD